MEDQVQENSDKVGVDVPVIEVPKRDEYKQWIKMTPEQALEAQDKGTLMGYHPGKGLGLVKPEENKKK